MELKHIVDIMLQVRAGAYSFEAANPRHEHEWRVWETVELPEGKALIPGIVTHASNLVEHPETVAQRIARFAGGIISEGEWISIDGDNGAIYFGRANIIRERPTADLAELDRWRAATDSRAAAEAEPKVRSRHIKSTSSRPGSRAGPGRR